MIKVIVIGGWLLIVAFGTVMLGHAMRGSAPTDMDTAEQETLELEQQSLELISIPVMVSGRVDGYVLVKLAYVVEKDGHHLPHLQLAPFISDEIYRQFFGAYSDASQIERIKIDDIREQIMTAINQRFEQPVLKDIMLEQFNYITADQVRNMNRDLNRGLVDTRENL